jgi:transposase
MNKPTRKRHLDPDIKIRASQEYLNGVKSSSQLGHELNVDPDTILNWAKKYKLHGAACFDKSAKNQSSQTAELQKEIDHLKSTLKAKDLEIEILKKFQASLKKNV